MTVIPGISVAVPVVVQVEVPRRAMGHQIVVTVRVQSATGCPVDARRMIDTVEMYRAGVPDLNTVNVSMSMPEVSGL